MGSYAGDSDLRLKNWDGIKNHLAHKELSFCFLHASKGTVMERKYS